MHKPPRTPPPRTPSLVHRLEAEWGRLCAAPPAAAALAQWARREAALAGFGDLEQLRTVVHDRRDPARSDAILAALVRQAAVTGHGDQLATRVVLQLLLPGAIRLRRSLYTDGADPEAVEATILSELTILIRTYPWQRRPRSIAANLLLDCRQRMVRGYRRTSAEVSAGLHPGEGGATSDRGTDQGTNTDDPLALHDLLWWAHRRGVLDPFEARLLVASHVQDIPMTELASRLGRSRSSLFMIRASAEQRLRQALDSRPAPDPQPEPTA